MAINYISCKAKVGIRTRVKAYVTIHDGVKIGDDCIIEDGAKIYEGCEIGNHTVIGANAVLRPNTKIGNNCIFGSGSISEGDNQIGNNCTIEGLCIVARYMKIGNNVFVGPGGIITNTKIITKGKHGTAGRTNGKWVVTSIDDNARVGADCALFPGIKVGKHSFVYMGSRVRQDVPAKSTLKL